MSTDAMLSRPARRLLDHVRREPVYLASAARGRRAVVVGRGGGYERVDAVAVGTVDELVHANLITVDRWQDKVPLGNYHKRRHLDDRDGVRARPAERTKT